MRRSAGLAVALLVAGLASGAATAEEDAKRIQAGKELFVRYCASCHGEDASGNGPVASELKEPPKDLRLISQRFGKPLAEAAVIERIDGRRQAAAHGTKTMPVWGDKLMGNVSESSVKETMTRGTLSQIVSYLDSIQR